MQEIQRPKPKLHSILTAAKKMARRYGQIGLDEPDDIVQAAMLKVLKRTDERPMPMLWLYKAVHSSAMEAGRKHSREARWMCAVADDERGQSVCDRVDEDGYLYSGGHYNKRRDDIEPDLMPRIKNTLNELRKPLKQALMLHVEGYSYEEIARMTNTKIGTVRSRLHYARKRARTSIGDQG